MVPIYYAPDEPVLIGTRIPPRANHEAPDNPEEPPATPDDASSDEDTREDDFQSAHSSDNDTPEDGNNGDPENTSGNNEEHPTGENAPESGPPPQEDPGNNPGEGTSGGASGSGLSRKAKSRAPIKRQRSMSIPPPGGLKWRDSEKNQLKHQLWDHRRQCAICSQGRGHKGQCKVYLQTRAQQLQEGAAPEDEPQEGEEPTPQEGEEDPQRTRSGRVIRPPDLLSYKKL